MKNQTCTPFVPLLLGCLCVLGGCSSSVTEDISTDTTQTTATLESEAAPATQAADESVPETPEETSALSEETESIFDEAPWENYKWLSPAPVTELAPEEISSNYSSFNYLCGMSLSEVQTALGYELTFVKEFGDSTIYTDSDHTEYRFLTAPDALYCIAFINLDADAALQLAKSYYEEIHTLYGDNFVYPVQWEIHKIKSSEELNNNKFKETYKELWPVLYNSRMEEKIKDFYTTDKVRLSLSLDTPLYQEQGYYSVGIAQGSISLNDGASTD